MSIQDNVREKMAEIKNETVVNPAGGKASKELKEKSIAAIMGGAAEWVTYMNLYAKNPVELARLIPSDGTENDPEMREARAYLVANAICAPGTTGTLIETVFDRLDKSPV